MLPCQSILPYEQELRFQLIGKNFSCFQNENHQGTPVILHILVLKKVSFKGAVKTNL